MPEQMRRVGRVILLTWLLALALPDLAGTAHEAPLDQPVWVEQGVDGQ